MAWTALAEDDAAQDVTAANEILLAYYERAQAIEDILIANDAFAGDDYYSKASAAPLSFYSKVKEIQEWVETNCVDFVDWTTGAAGEFADSAVTIPTLTWATLKTKALGGNGWRRCATTPGTFAYGRAQEDDVQGRWLIEDLQAAFTYLTQTVRYNTDGNVTQHLSEGRASGLSDSFDDCDDAVADMKAKFTAASWGATGFVIAYAAYAMLEHPSQYDAAETRVRGKIKATSVPVVNACTIDTYFFMRAEGSTFAALDAAIAAVEDTWFFHETWASAQTATRGADDASYIGNYDTHPWDLSSLACPDPGEEGIACYRIDASDKYICCVLRWTFTNA